MRWGDGSNPRFQRAVAKSGLALFAARRKINPGSHRYFLAGTNVLTHKIFVASPGIGSTFQRLQRKKRRGKKQVKRKRKRKRKMKRKNTRRDTRRYLGLWKWSNYVSALGHTAGVTSRKILSNQLGSFAISGSNCALLPNSRHPTLSLTKQPRARPS